MAPPGPVSHRPKPRAIVNQFAEPASVGTKGSSEEAEEEQQEEEQDKEVEEGDENVDGDSECDPLLLGASGRMSSGTLFHTPSTGPGRLSGLQSKSRFPGSSAADRIKQWERDAASMQMMQLENENLRLQLEVRF